MKKTILLSSLFFLGFSSYTFVHSQQAMLCREVMASAGGDAFVNNKQFEFTLGEPFIATIGNGTKVLTQGFHQPEICPLLVGTSDLAEAAGIRVYPNPVTSELHVKFEAPTGRFFQIQVYNALGQQVLDLPTTVDTQPAVVHCAHLPSGSYYLAAHTNTGALLFSVPFLKVDQ